MTRAINADDLDLVYRMREGDKEAASVLLARYRRLLFSVSFKILRNEPDAEDITQEILLQIWNRAEQYDATRGTVKMWMLQYAYSRSLTRFEVLRNRAAKETELEPPPTLDPKSNQKIKVVRPELTILNDPTAQIAQVERQAQVKMALRKLPQEYRKVISLIYFQGLNPHEVAAKTGYEFGNVRNMYYRGLKQMRETIRVAEKKRRRNESRPIYDLCALPA